MRYREKAQDQEEQEIREKKEGKTKDKKEQLVQNLGKPVEHELYPAHNELSLAEHKWYPTHYKLAKKHEKNA